MFCHIWELLLSRVVTHPVQILFLKEFYRSAEVSGRP